MIDGFDFKETRKIFNREFSRKFPVEIQRVALRKLFMIEAAIDITDLKIPPANRLEKLRGDFKGFYSMSINKQWRIIFKWRNSKASRVKIIDYH